MMKRMKVIFFSIAMLAVCVSLAAAQEEPAKAKAPDLRVGESIFKSKCAFCHGDTGDGQGPSGKFLKPPPGNFTDAAWIHGGEMENIITTIKEGVKGTAMVGFGSTLTENEIRSVAAFVQYFSAGKGEAAKEVVPPAAEGQEQEAGKEEQQQ